MCQLQGKTVLFSMPVFVFYMVLGEIMVKPYLVASLAVKVAEINLSAVLLLLY